MACYFIHWLTTLDLTTILKKSVRPEWIRPKRIASIEQMCRVMDISIRGGGGEPFLFLCVSSLIYALLLYSIYVQCTQAWGWFNIITSCRWKEIEMLIFNVTRTDTFMRRAPLHVTLSVCRSVPICLWIHF